jgi:hypothetical protein
LAPLIGLGLFAALLIPGTTPGLVESVAVRLAAITALALAASLAAMPYIYVVKVNEALKNRRDTRSLAAFNLALKALLSLVLIVMGSTGIAR